MKGIVIGPGSIKGFVYIGAVSALKKYRKDCRFFSGCSIGSLLAYLLCIGMDTDEVIMRFSGDSFSDMAEFGNDIFTKSFTGIFNMEPLRQKLENITERVLGLRNPTFQELYKKTNGMCFICDATNIKNSTPTFFHHQSTPNYSAIQAVINSCSIPVLFQGQDNEEGIFVDGAVSHPFCIMELAKLMREVNVPIYKKVKGHPAETHDIFVLYMTRQFFTHTLSTDIMPINTFLEDMDDIKRKKTDEILAIFNRSTRTTLESFPINTTIETSISYASKYYRQIFACLTESLSFNNMKAEILNALKKYPYKIFLLSLPGFPNLISATNEEKVDMYFAGRDVAEMYMDMYKI